MGNRAVITIQPEGTPTQEAINEQIGIYLHWNGGRDSIEPFLKYCELRGFRPPEQDCYGWARLCQVIANGIGGDLSVGIDQCRHLDCNNYDNGVYLIKNWRIVGRMYHEGAEQQEYNLVEFVKELDKDQPRKDQLGDAKIDELLAKAGE